MKGYSSIVNLDSKIVLPIYGFVIIKKDGKPDIFELRFIGNHLLGKKM